MSECHPIMMPGQNHPQCADPRLIEALIRVQGMATDLGDIKTAMREMAQAIGKLAIVEERQQQDRDQIGRLFKVSDDHDARLQTLEKSEPMQRQTSEWVGKVVTIVITVVTTAVVGLVVVKTAAPAAAPTVIAPR